MRQRRTASTNYFCTNTSEGKFFTTDLVLNGILPRILHDILCLMTPHLVYGVESCLMIQGVDFVSLNSNILKYRNSGKKCRVRCPQRSWLEKIWTSVRLPSPVYLHTWKETCIQSDRAHLPRFLQPWKMEHNVGHKRYITLLYSFFKFNTRELRSYHHRDS